MIVGFVSPADRAGLEISDLVRLVRTQAKG